MQSNVLAHNGSKVLLATDHTCAAGSSVGFSILVSSPRTTIGLWVHDPFAGDPSSHQVTLQGFQADNSDAGMTSLSITSGLGWQQLLLVADPGKTIVSAFMALAVKSEVLERKKEYETMPVLRNLVPAQVLVGNSSFNTGNSISAGLPVYVRNRIKAIATIIDRE